jgi:hypothetical protein
MLGDMDANPVIAILSAVVLGPARRPPFAHSACLPEGTPNFRSSTGLTMFAPRSLRELLAYPPSKPLGLISINLTNSETAHRRGTAKSSGRLNLD